MASGESVHDQLGSRQKTSRWKSITERSCLVRGSWKAEERKQCQRGRDAKPGIVPKAVPYFTSNRQCALLISSEAPKPVRLIQLSWITTEAKGQSWDQIHLHKSFNVSYLSGLSRNLVTLCKTINFCTPGASPEECSCKWWCPRNSWEFSACLRHRELSWLCMWAALDMLWVPYHDRRSTHPFWWWKILESDSSFIFASFFTQPSRNLVNFLSRDAECFSSGSFWYSHFHPPVYTSVYASSCAPLFMSSCTHLCSTIVC